MINAPIKKSFGLSTKWLAVLICCSISIAAQNSRTPSYDFRTAAPLIATLNSHNGQYLFNVTNNSDQELRGVVSLSLGNETGQIELGQFPVTVPPNDSKLYLLKGISAQGNVYTLRLYSSNQTLLLYKIATLGRVTDGALSQTETITLSGNIAVNNASTAPSSSEVLPAVTQKLPDEIKVKIRIAAGPQPDDPFVLVFELSGQRSLFDATLQMSLGSAKATKPVSINGQTVVEFNTPGEVGDGVLSYVLTRKDGSIVIKGETSLDKLFADDVVTVSDIRTDKVAYAPGETARLIIMLEGNSKEGYRLEISAHDTHDSQFFSTVLYGKEGEKSNEQPVLLGLPTDAKDRVTLKFKLYDAANNALFDSGEREITINEKP